MIDWSKETRCTPCRMPQTEGGKKVRLAYTPVVCRTCKHIKISECSDCGVEMGLCMYNQPKYNCPPTLDLDKKRKCVCHAS